MANHVFQVSETEEQTLLRRRISNSAANSASDSSSSASSTTTFSSSSSFISDDLELITIKPNPHSYTSLKDLLPSAAVNSPKISGAHFDHPGPDICIRNHLVKQAARAYLQPMSTSPGPAGGNFFSRLWPRIAAVFDFLYRNAKTAVLRALQALHLRDTR